MAGFLFIPGVMVGMALPTLDAKGPLDLCTGHSCLNTKNSPRITIGLRTNGLSKELPFAQLADRLSLSQTVVAVIGARLRAAVFTSERNCFLGTANALLQYVVRCEIGEINNLGA